VNRGKLYNRIVPQRKWYSIKNEDKLGRFAEVMVYDEIGFFGVSASDFANDLSNLDVDEVVLRINSPGGEVFDGIAIYNSLKKHKAKVNVKVEGLAASIASVIAMAGDTIEIDSSAMMMIHEGHSLSVGNAEDMRKQAELLDKVSETIAGIYAERAGGTPKEWRARMQAETWYDATEAVASGLADSVHGVDSPGNRWDISLVGHTIDNPAARLSDSNTDAAIRALREALK